MEKPFDINYIIHSDGRVWSVRRKIFLKPMNRQGYLRVEIYKKNYNIHRLVAQAFIPNPNNFTDVNHINGNKQDNRVENLEWCNRRYNVNHFFKSKFPGAYKRKNGRYTSFIKYNGKQYALGTYDTPEEASNAYITFLAQHKV